MTKAQEIVGKHLNLNEIIYDFEEEMNLEFQMYATDIVNYINENVDVEQYVAYMKGTLPYNTEMEIGVYENEHSVEIPLFIYHVGYDVALKESLFIDYDRLDEIRIQPGIFDNMIDFYENYYKPSVELFHNISELMSK